MAGKRRKSKYTWFPTIGTTSVEGSNIAAAGFAIGVDGGGAIETGILPLTFDKPQELDLNSADDPGVLAGIVGQEYFLRRVVGKLHLHFEPYWTPDNLDTTPKACYVGAGIFVARASDAEDGDLPIGAQDPDEIRESYSPLAASTIREPWIWRRTWILGNPALRAFWYNNMTAATGVPNQSSWGLDYPGTNSEYGSVADGPHVDAKTARRVSQDERLWIAVSTMRYPIQDNVVDFNLRGLFDFRILAQLRKPHNRGVF